MLGQPFWLSSTNVQATALSAYRSLWTRVEQHSYKSQPKRSIFTYHFAASAAGKRTSVSRAEHGGNYFSQSLAQREPSYFSSRDAFSGEDAFFMAHVGKSKSHVVLGIADGVGGWREAGIDPGVFSHGLCKFMADTAYKSTSTSQELRPKTLMTNAFEQVLQDKSVVAGGSTAAVATLEEDGAVEIANLGDSGVAIFEPGRVAYQSEPQTSGFNTPYQLTKLTPQMRAQQQIFGDNSAEQTPSVADVSNHKFKQGTVMVLATDGVWDNLDAMDVLNTVSSIMEKKGQWDLQAPNAAVNASALQAMSLNATAIDQDVASLLAFTIMRQAKVASLDRKRDGPFARELKKHYPREQFQGGKTDDITVVVCIAVEAQVDHMPVKAKL